MNGKVSAEISYSGGIYDGTSYWYYENGNLKDVITFSNGKVNGWVRTYYESGLLKEEKYVEEGRLNGIAKTYYANGALESIRTYEDGFLVKREQFDYDPYYSPPIEAYQAGNRQQKSKKKKDDEFLCDVEICPEPLGGMESIYEKLIYPSEARAYGLEGNVRVVAEVSSKGKVMETNVISGIGLGCDEAAVDAIKATRFLPGQNNGVPVAANVTLTVEFELEKDSETKVSTRENLPSTESVAAPRLGVENKAASSNETATKKEKSDPDDSRYAVKESNEAKNLEPTTVQKRDPAQDEIANSDYLSCSGVDICAEPIGGLKSVIDNLDIPGRVKENNVRGVVIIQCEVNERGKVRNTVVKKGLPHGASVAVEVALIYTKFNPALRNGEPVKSNVTVKVPVNY